MIPISPVVGAANLIYMHTSSATTTKRTLQRASVLIIEDNPDEQILIQRACEQALGGIDVICVSSTAEALNYLDGCDGQTRVLPKLIFLDLYLPNAEQGWSFLRQMKERSWQRSLPILVLSQSDRPEDIVHCYDLGANSYITKPLSMAAWFAYFESVRLYWWETATLPVVNSESPST